VCVCSHNTTQDGAHRILAHRRYSEHSKIPNPIAPPPRRFQKRRSIHLHPAAARRLRRRRPPNPKEGRKRPQQPLPNPPRKGSNTPTFLVRPAAVHRKTPSPLLVLAFPSLAAFAPPGEAKQGKARNPPPPPPWCRGSRRARGRKIPGPSSFAGAPRSPHGVIRREAGEAAARPGRRSPSPAT
jgi:hypothetical protein